MAEAVALDQEQERDFERQARLEEERAKYNKEEGEKMRGLSRRLARFHQRIPHIGFMEGGLVSFAAGVADTIDYLVVGSLSVVGDILDVGIWMFIAIWVWARGIKRPTAALLSGVIELIPFGDLLPTFIAMVLAIIIYNNSIRKSGAGKLRGAMAKIKNTKSS